MDTNSDSCQHMAAYYKEAINKATSEQLEKLHRAICPVCKIERFFDKIYIEYPSFFRYICTSCLKQIDRDDLND